MSDKSIETTYIIDFDNETNRTWTLGVYQTLPKNAGLDSVSWKQTTVPPNGSSGVEWNVDYLVGIANYKQIGGKGVYRASQKLSTELGWKWSAKFEHGAQQLFRDGDADPGHVLISNESNALANLAIGMDGDIALIQRDVNSGAKAQFGVKPTYWVALFNDLHKGELIEGNTAVGPFQVTFPSGVTSLTYRAYNDGARIEFKPVELDLT